LLGRAEPILITGGRAVVDYREAFVGIDVAKLRNAIAIADAGREGEVRFLGEVDASGLSMRRVIERIAAKFDRLHFCYEAGPTGYGLYRLVRSLGHECTVVAPSLIPRKPGDRVKTNRRDAVALARLLRAGELTAVWVPDEAHEAMRDLVRARQAAVHSLRRSRQQLSGFLLRHGHHYHRPAWTQMHRRWLSGLRFAQPAHHVVFEDAIETIEAATARRDRLTAQIEALLPSWSLAPVVLALQAMRGMALVNAATLIAELGDLTRFADARQLMAFLGLVPSENSSGGTVSRGGITKTGNTAARRVLVEAAWTYRFPARISREQCLRQEALSKPVRDIAWKAQLRLRSLSPENRRMW
jgi:transposase